MEIGVDGSAQAFLFVQVWDLSHSMPDLVAGWQAEIAISLGNSEVFLSVLLIVFFVGVARGNKRIVAIDMMAGAVDIDIAFVIAAEHLSFIDGGGFSEGLDFRHFGKVSQIYFIAVIVIRGLRISVQEHVGLWKVKAIVVQIQSNVENLAESWEQVLDTGLVWIEVLRIALNDQLKHCNEGFIDDRKLADRQVAVRDHLRF